MRPALVLALLLAVLVPRILLAQSGKVVMEHGRTSEVISPAQEKQLHMLLSGVDASARLSIHTDRRNVKILHAQDLADGALASIFQLAGLELQLLQNTLGPGTGHDADQIGPPGFIDTGNPELDAQNHAAAKAAWIEAHPDAYQELLKR